MKTSKIFAALVVVTALAVLSAELPAQQTGSNDVLNWGEDWATMRLLDPRVSQSRHEHQAMMHIFDSLIFRGNDGKLYPWLAESWKFSEDGRSLTLRLRRGVKFHDGTPFNAQAVKFTFDSIRDPKLGSQTAIDIMGPYRSTDVVDQYTVRINWSRPYGQALLALSQVWLSIVSPAAVQRLGDDEFSRKPVGTGMYKFVEWIPRERIVLERNEEYDWAPEFFKRRGPARIKRIVMRIIPDASTRVVALEKHEIDVAESVPALDVRRLKGSRDFDVMLGDVTGIPECLMFNLSKAPADDVRVRQAFMYAVNRPRVVEQAFFGLKKPVYSILTANTAGYWPGAEQMYPYDLAKARQLLEEAGWKAGPDGVRVKNGQRLELFFRNLVFPEVAVAVQAAVKEVGIQLNVENVLKARQDEYILNNDYDVLTLSWGGAVAPGLLNIVYNSRNIPRPGKFGFNWNQIRSAGLDRLLAQADSSIDPQQSERTLASIQKLVLERALAFPIHPLVQATGFHRSVQNLMFNQEFYQVWFYNVSISR